MNYREWCPSSTTKVVIDNTVDIGGEKSRRKNIIKGLRGGERKGRKRVQEVLESRF